MTEADIRRIIREEVERRLLSFPHTLAQHAYTHRHGGSDPHAIITRRYFINACEAGKNKLNPPAINDYGITHVLEFTVDNDVAHYELDLPLDYAYGDIHVHILWTRSSTGSDDSNKVVKWQLNYLAIDSKNGNNCNAGESTLTVQDTYESSDLDSQIVYCTDALVIPESDLKDKDLIIIDLMAVTPDGVALSEPAVLAVNMLYKAYQIL